MNWTLWAGLIGFGCTGCWLCWPTINKWFDPVERARHSPEPDYFAGGYSADKPASEIGPITARVPVQVVDDDPPVRFNVAPQHGGGWLEIPRSLMPLYAGLADDAFGEFDRSGLLLIPRSPLGHPNNPDGNQHVADDDNTAWHANVLIARLTDELAMQSPMEQVADWIRNSYADPTAELIHYADGTYTYPEETNR